ncbi:polysaccharide biosynthesis protein [Planctomyces sp. SH-PL14]|uniref:polysaccharide biosynthesis protein n=1 Tax=Planctomyces sp. SH-PL14 TaxID=1632864 RepID=UPI00078D06B9|nr:nucleoside-diphosphate sugar epimerase/dehydratase [Planctomyces sp. SH-PL14]AMV21446.1 UDP-N-acetyl-alpha-D-glucosamine C6 dehydratase [Planctomyces sp. SH-PL14]
MKYRLFAIIPAYLLLYFSSFAMAFGLRFDFQTTRFIDSFWATVPIAVCVKALCCLLWSEWRGSFRFPTVYDIVRVGCFAATTAFLLAAINLLVPGAPNIPRTVIVIDGALGLLGLGMLRVAYRVFGEVVGPRLRTRRLPKALIYTIGHESIGILRMLSSTSMESRPFRITGFVQAGREHRSSRIGGRPVYPKRLGWDRIRTLSGAGHLLIPASVPGRVVRGLLRECADAGIAVSMIPAVGELVEGRIKLGVRDVTVNDLLRREPNRLDMNSLRSSVTGKRVLVTGGAGSIGSELCRQLLSLAPEGLVIYDQSEFGVFSMEQELSQTHPGADIRYVIADILDEDRLGQVFDGFRPHLVFHAAAYKHVPLMEDNPQSAIMNNVFGTKAVADAALRVKAERYVQISTDKAVRPTSVMGATKLVAENYVQSLAQHGETQFLTVRFGNVLNSMGSVVPTFRKQIEAGGPITVTDPEMKRFFMTIPEAVQLVIQAGVLGVSGEILILDMGDPVRIVDLAKDMIILSGLRYPDDIDIVFTGLRPGEKLYEELFYSSEKGARKVHEKIFAGDREQIRPAIQVLADLRRLREGTEVSAESALVALREITCAYSETPWTPSRLKAA